MTKRAGLFLALVIVISFPHKLWADAASPAAEELLDFDSADKSGKTQAPSSNVVVPPPAAAVPAPIQPATPPTGQAAPPVTAPPTGAATTSSLPVLPPADQDATAAGGGAFAPTTSAPPPTVQAAPPPPAVSAQDSQALEGAAAAAPTPLPPAPPPVVKDKAANVAPPPALPEAAPSDVALPPPEIVNDTPAPTIQAPALPPPPATTENFPSSTTTEAPPPPAPSNSQMTAEVGEVSDSDRRNEERFSRIYQKYNQNELGDQKWGQIAGDKSSENYSIQDGDNLWDISTKFFGNGFYWPKVWQLNDTITNPHQVRVGNTIKFQPGTATSAPSLTIEQTNNLNINNNNEVSYEDLPEPAPEVEEIPTADEPTGNTILIPPPKKRRPVLGKIPDSFPDWRDQASRYDAAGFSMEVFRPIKDHRLPSAVPSIISQEPWGNNGEVVEMEGETTVASTWQYIIVRLDVAAKKGDYFTIFSNSGHVSDPTSLLPSTVGYEVDTRAEMKIENLIEGTTDTYRALIVYTTMPVRIGDQVRQGRLISRVFYDEQGSPSNVSSKIVNGVYNQRQVFAQHDVVYLDRGSEDGLQVGSLLHVIKNAKVRNQNSIIKFDPKPIGILKVVAVDTHVATAAIIIEHDAIMPGDETSVPAENELTGEEKQKVLEKTAPPPGGAGAVGDGGGGAAIVEPNPL